MGSCMDDAHFYRLLHETPLEHLSLEDLRIIEYEIHRPRREEVPPNCAHHYEQWHEPGTCVFHEPGDPRATLFAMPRDPRLLEVLLEPDIAQE